jgi:hypothetical protein
MARILADSGTFLAPAGSRTPAQFLGCLFVRNDPITKDVGVQLLQVLNNHRVSNRFSLAVDPIVSAEEHAEPGTEREMHR